MVALLFLETSSFSLMQEDIFQNEKQKLFAEAVKKQAEITLEVCRLLSLPIVTFFLLTREVLAQNLFYA